MFENNQPQSTAAGGKTGKAVYTLNPALRVSRLPLARIFSRSIIIRSAVQYLVTMRYKPLSVACS
jgi:hypothetical protein